MTPKLKLVHNTPMTFQQFRHCLKRLGWDTPFLAEHLTEDFDRVMHWYGGAETIPTAVKRYLELRLKLKELSDA